jgi:hypothetical protein
VSRTGFGFLRGRLVTASPVVPQVVEGTVRTSCDTPSIRSKTHAQYTARFRLCGGRWGGGGVTVAGYDAGCSGG